MSFVAPEMVVLSKVLLARCARACMYTHADVYRQDWTAEVKWAVGWAVAAASVWVVRI